MAELYINDFDSRAAEWDNNPMHWDRSEAIAKGILNLIPIKKEMTALEFGAGSGILSFMLKNYFREITMFDNSTEMIRVINGKIEKTKAENLKALNIDLEHSDFNGGGFDLIFTQMVLHHVGDVDIIIKKFYNLLNPGGYIAIADLYAEDGSFHGEGFVGRRGFDIVKLSAQLSKVGFSNISERQCFVINRKISDTETKEFGAFLMIANKKEID
jgi:tRNA (cmo5U34)-methyltransferase